MSLTYLSQLGTTAETPNPNTNGDNEIVSNPMPSITCGCGFTVTGVAEPCAQELFDSHICVEAKPAWHESVFSFFGFFAIAVVVLGIVQIVVGGVL